MKLIKVIYKDDEVLTRINGTVEEIAKNYFWNADVLRIKLLEGFEEDTEYFTKTLTEIYRAEKKDIEEFQLYNNIRVAYKVLYKKHDGFGYDMTGETITSSCGLMRI